MTRSQATALCGGTTSKGTPCTQVAGWGTDHLGTGTCKLHLGTTRNHRKRAATIEALKFTRYALGAEAPIDPLDAQLLSVYLANGIVEFYRAKLAEQNGKADAATLQGYRDAMADLNKFSRNAIDSKVAERMLKITERQAETFVLVCEAALGALIAAGVKLSNKHRTVYAEAVRGELARLESEPVTIEGDATP